MTEIEFRRELNRLYAKAVAIELTSWDLAEAAGVKQDTMLRWLGGYAYPEPQQHVEILRCIASRLET